MRSCSGSISTSRMELTDQLPGRLVTIRSEHVDFEGSRGARLAARIDLPDASPVRAYAVFAHCFTCNKDIKAPVAIGRALAEAGIATLRFDFTGLGASGGDFGETTFTSNIDDLLSAARFVAESYGKVQLVIGHSLGGAAALRAAALLDSVRAAVTIGAPYRPRHVLHHLAADLSGSNGRGSQRSFLPVDRCASAVSSFATSRNTAPRGRCGVSTNRCW